MGAAQIWLDVPFGEKDEAKALGARWDPAAKRWYAPRPGMTALQRWAALPDVPDLLPGEDRSFGAGLFVDLVPQSCWFTNVRSCVVPRDWERLRRMIRDRAGQRCEICGAGEDRELGQWLEAHERWFYDDVRQVQVLRRLICLCTGCHITTHFGYAQVTGNEAAAFDYLCAVAGMSAAQARQHIGQAFDVWQARSGRTWTLDLSLLTDAGITLAAPPAAGRRAAAADRQVRAVRSAERQQAEPGP